MSLKKGDVTSSSLAVELDPVQKACLQTHTEELLYIETHGQRVPFLKRALRLVLGNDFYALLTGSLQQLAQLVFFLFANPAFLLTDPIGFVYGGAAYSLLFLGLSAFATVTFLVKAFRLDKLVINPILNRYGAGLSLVNCSLPAMFGICSPAASEQHRLDCQTRFLEIYEQGTNKLTREPARHCHLFAEHPIQPLDGCTEAEKDAIHKLGTTRLATFDLDIARFLLTLSALVYERDSELVAEAAKRSSAQTETLLLESERIIHETVLRTRGIRYVTVSDFVTVSGPYAAAFYPEIGPDNKDVKPWIVLVFKHGTDPQQFLEWQTDATLTHVDASDNFFAGSACHKGFYEKLFPAVGSDAPSQPHRSIHATIEAIAAELKAATGQQAQLWICGHSLGAGLASLYFTYQLLNHPRPRANFRLRDAYLFGCPSVGDAGFVSGFEKLYNYDGNTSTAFRIRNNFDIVSTVPPGLANPRDTRLSLNPNGLLDYGQIGIGIRLKPNKKAPFAVVEQDSVPPGTQVAVVEKSGPLPPLVQTKGGFNPIILIDRIGTLLGPFIANHAPPQYYESLLRMNGDALSKATNKTNHFVYLKSDDVYGVNEKAGLFK